MILVIFTSFQTVNFYFTKSQLTKGKITFSQFGGVSKPFQRNYSFPFYCFCLPRTAKESI